MSTSFGKWDVCLYFCEIVLRGFTKMTIKKRVLSRMIMNFLIWENGVFFCGITKSAV